MENLGQQVDLSTWLPVLLKQDIDNQNICDERIYLIYGILKKSYKCLCVCVKVNKLYNNSDLIRTLQLEQNIHSSITCYNEVIDQF